MEFTRLNPTSIKLSVNQIDIIIGPDISEGDVQLLTKATPDTGANRNVRRFYGPGEYEAQGVMIDGAKAGNDDISYQIIHDGVSVAALSIANVEALTDELVDELLPAQVICVWLATGTTQDLATILGRFDTSMLVVPVVVPFEMDDIEKELQLKAEELSKLKVSARDANIEQRRLVKI